MICKVIDQSLLEAVKDNDGYCLCTIDRNDDTKCPCKEFRESKEGTECHCGLYYKVKGE